MYNNIPECNSTFSTPIPTHIICGHDRNRQQIENRQLLAISALLILGQIGRLACNCSRCMNEYCREAFSNAAPSCGVLSICLISVTLHGTLVPMSLGQLCGCSCYHGDVSQFHCDFSCEHREGELMDWSTSSSVSSV